MMKKILWVLVITIFVFNFAFAEEIVFQNIPWLANDVTVLQILKEAGLYRGNEDVLTITSEDVVIINKNEDLNYQPNTMLKHKEYYKDYCFGTLLGDTVKGKIAGSPVNNIALSFAYDGEYKLIAIRLDLLNTDFATLKAKLTKIYGEGESKTVEDEGIESIVWKGDNSSGVLLYTESEGMEYQLYYGRLDAADILAKCMEQADPDDVTGL